LPKGYLDELHLQGYKYGRYLRHSIEGSSGNPRPSEAASGSYPIGTVLTYICYLEYPSRPENTDDRAVSRPNAGERGFAIELIHRVIAYDVKSSLLLLAAMPTQAIGPLATLLVDVSIPLLGQTPALDPLPEQQVTASTAGSRSRTLTLARGEYVTVVGWLEGDQSNLASKVSYLVGLRDVGWIEI
jgi:hypothetical protein